ncbi:MAG: type II toxin-antitoxin system RelE/ParE family toxin [Oscillospiraceae bacterium]|nr:type II toxin-antitoxin system RelE/ParE family toxin [Oscillospiraceae bacterium]
MTKEFIITKTFDRKWHDLGLTDDDLQKLQEELLQNPEIGDIIKGTGGARKVRFALPSRGKSGGVRIIYVDAVYAECIHLLFCYRKGQQDDLTDEQKKQFKVYIKSLKGA